MLLLALGGLAIGLVAIHWTGALLKSLLYQTEPAEPQTLAAVALAASLVSLRLELSS